jgi:hypothetical protein
MRINEIIAESTELEEGWKSKLAGAALAGAAALGGGHTAQAGPGLGMPPAASATQSGQSQQGVKFEFGNVTMRSVFKAYMTLSAYAKDGLLDNYHIRLRGQAASLLDNPQVKMQRDRDNATINGASTAFDLAAYASNDIKKYSGLDRQRQIEKANLNLRDSTQELEKFVEINQPNKQSNEVSPNRDVTYTTQANKIINFKKTHAQYFPVTKEVVQKYGNDGLQILRSAYNKIVAEENDLNVVDGTNYEKYKDLMKNFYDNITVYKSFMR